MIPARPDRRRLIACLDQPEVRACGEAHVAKLRAQLVDAAIDEGPGPGLIRRGNRSLGRILPFGSVAFYVPTGPTPLRHRLLEVDRNGHVTLAVGRGPDGAFRDARVRNVDGAILGILAGGADHPLWGASDRIVRLAPAADSELLTVCGTVNWDAVTAIPPLADPSRLPAGAGTSILNALATLATDHARGPLRYRGPYPTEQLFWALAESFRFGPAPGDPLATFTGAAEATFAAGEVCEAPLDWTAAPHERLFLDEGIYVQLREGVEKVYWEGRLYYRTVCQGLRRREHRVIRVVTAPEGEPKFVASLAALGRPLEDHLVLDALGNLLERPLSNSGQGGPHPAEADAVGPLARPWVEALGALLPLEATPLLAPAIAAVWPGLRAVWGPVPRDLIETTAATLRLSTALARAYETQRVALPSAARRTLAQGLVGEVLGLLGPPVRRAAAGWLEAEPPARRESLLREAARIDRRAMAAHAAGPLGRLLALLEAGDALPPTRP